MWQILLTPFFHFPNYMQIIVHHSNGLFLEKCAQEMCTLKTHINSVYVRTRVCQNTHAFPCRWKPDKIFQPDMQQGRGGAQAGFGEAQHNRHQEFFTFLGWRGWWECVYAHNSIYALGFSAGVKRRTCVCLRHGLLFLILFHILYVCFFPIPSQFLLLFV